MSDAAACASALRDAAERDAPHEKTLYYRAQAVATDLRRAGRCPLSATALAALTGEIGAWLEDDAVLATELPFWRDVAERVAAVLDAMSSDDDATAAALTSDLARHFHPPPTRQ